MNRFRFSRLTAFLSCLLVLLAACHRDPNYAKQQYLSSGNKYFAKNRYKEALIMYRKALATDPKYGEAYYRLALTYEALGQTASVVGVLRRATQLLPKGTPEWNDAALKLGSQLVQGAVMGGDSGQSKPLLDEVAQLQATLDAKAPNSFEDYRLKAEVNRAKAAREIGQRDVPALKKDLESAVADLRKSSELRPNDVSTSLALARTLALYGQLKESEQIYQGLLDKDKTFTPAYVELYRLYSAENRPAEAEQLLNRAIANNPKNFSFRTLLASYYFNHHDQTNMLRVLADLKSHHKDFPEAYLTVGDFYARIGDLNSAMQQYREGEQNDAAKRPEYGKREVEVLLRQGKRDEALTRVQEMLKADPKDVDAKGLQASFALDRGEVDKAIAEFQDVVNQKPDNFVAHYDLGRAFAAKGESQRAAQQFQESIKIRPDYLRPRAALAEVQLQVGEFEQALKTAQETERMSANNGAVRLVEGVALMRTGKPDEARKVFADLLQKYPKFSDVYLELGALEMTQKNYAAAREDFAKAIAINPNDLRALTGQAETWVAQGEPAKGLALFKEQVAAHPERADLLNAYATLEMRTGQYDQALADYQTLLGRVKQSPRETAQVYASLGQLNFRKGDSGAAVSWLEKARAAEPNSIPILLFLAQAYDRLGRASDSQKAYRQVLAQDPGNVSALNNLAFALSQNNSELNEALTLATKAKQALPNSAEVDDTLGVIYLKKGMADVAVDTFRTITAKDPANPAFHYHYCMALYQKGDKAGAQKECSTALADKPNTGDASGARQLLAKLQ